MQQNIIKYSNISLRYFALKKNKIEWLGLLKK